MVDATKPLPVTLNSWPTCENCLSWCEDYLAVAGGEVVYVLVPRNSSTNQKTGGHPQWKILTLRANLFSQEQWPERDPITVKYFSIGEEQSSSHVVALAWSPDGLGVHRRAVLAVLTSNLILSLWETDGSSDQFERTCVINNYLYDRSASFDSGVERQKSRVRAFAWLPSIQTRSKSRWGLQHLIVVDDRGALLILHVTKEKGDFVGCWHCETVFHHPKSHLGLSNGDVQAMSPLHCRLYEQTPVTMVHVSTWEVVSSLATERDEARRLRCKVKLRRGSWTQVKILSVSIFAHQDHPAFSIDEHHNDKFQITANRNGMSNILLQSSGEHVATNDGQPSAECFKDALQPLQEAFDATNHLAGHYRVHFWGTTMSSSGTQMVACITLHPSDMIEYTIPSTEKSTLIFTSLTSDLNQARSVTKSTQMVQQDVLKLVSKLAEDSSNIVFPFDRKVLLSFSNLSSFVDGSGARLRHHLRQSNHQELLQFNQDAQGSISTEESSRHVNSNLDSAETCEICGAAIPFASDTSGAVCLSGHYFSRCQLTFLTIQEPGISKYCSQCSKQFLHLTKLKVVDGPCLAQTIFDEFDVCPYCQAKFRG